MIIDFDNRGGGGGDLSDYYTKEQTNALIQDFITASTSDLVNYFLKSETYTRSEIEALVGQITSFEVVATLPVSDIKTNVIYLLGPIGTGADRYEEYIYSNNTWVKIGETSIDLSNYVTITQLNTALGFYTTTQQLQTLLAGKQDTLTAGDRITISSSTISADSQIGSLTQQEYDALGTNVDPDVVYVITDASPVVLATVATTGDYDDLINKPTIPVVPTLATVATTGAYSDLTGTPTLATVATSGSYSDLSNTPVLATVATTGDYSDLSNTPTLATVATSGSYNDLTDKPVIPDAVSGTNDGTNWTSLTIGTDTYDIPQGGGGDTEEIELAIAAAINDTRDTISQDLHNNYVKTQSMNDALKNYAPKSSLDNFYSKAQIDTQIGTVTDEIEDKERATSFALNDLEVNKQDKLTAGSGITIGTDNTISAIGTDTVALTFTLANLSTVTYNVVIN